MAIIHLEHATVISTAPDLFHLKNQGLAFHFALVEFTSHDQDPAFLLRHQSHLTAKGWMFYNRALDDFFNERVPRT